jgi:hypothetical protein
MTLIKAHKRRYATGAAVLLATGSLALSPLAMPAFAAKSVNMKQQAAPNWSTMFTPAGGDSLLVQKLSATRIVSNARFPFTPVSAGENPNRTITVAARADSRLTANAVSVRNGIAELQVGNGKAMRLSSVDYRLTTSKGWQGISLPTQRISSTPMTELGKGGFRLEESRKTSKFSTNIRLDQSRETAPPARGNAASGDYKLVVGGSFSISRKIDVTAGVRYASENDRVIPRADSRKDSEAVYVGTKIRF